MRVLALLPLLLAGACKTSHPDEAPPPPRAVPADVPAVPPERQWCVKDCFSGEEPGLASELKARGSAAEPYLREALRDGPWKEDRERVERQARERYEARREELAMAYLEETVDADVLRRARAITLEEYVAAALGDYDVSYRARAISGLVVVRCKDAIPDLEQIAADPDHPLNRCARDALTELR